MSETESSGQHSKLPNTSPSSQTKEHCKPKTDDLDDLTCDSGNSAISSQCPDSKVAATDSSSKDKTAVEKISPTLPDTPTTRTLRQRKATESLYAPPKRQRHSQGEKQKAEKLPVPPSIKKLPLDESHNVIEKRKVLPRRPGISWSVGARLEAMDYLQKWYPAKIVSVDEEDQEVLIHFDRWNSRFDEWLEMRSDRLRAPTQHISDPVDHHTSADVTTYQAALPKLHVGSVVLAKWNNTSALKYPAIVKAVKSKTVINIEFYDGVESEVLVSTVQRLPAELQKEALHIWNLMNEITESEDIDKEKKMSRREAMEAKKLHQDKLDAAEGLLTKLIEQAGKTISKLNITSVTDKKTTRLSAAKVLLTATDPTSAISKDSLVSHSDTSSKKRNSDEKVGTSSKDSTVSHSEAGSKKRNNDDKLRVSDDVESSPQQEMATEENQSKDVGSAKAQNENKTTKRRNSSITKSNALSEDNLLCSVSLPVVELDKSNIMPTKTPQQEKTRRNSGRKSTTDDKACDGNSKFGYTVVIEPVDAKPAKAFVVEEDHNHFKCSHCPKGFRKESLLKSHVKHYHSVDGAETPTQRKRRKTFSHCSSDSEMVTPVSTAPSTPLVSPAQPREPSSFSIAKKSHSQSLSYTQTTNDMDYDAETDDDIGDGESSLQSYHSEVVNCICGFNEEDDLMIQCELCYCWQHAECFKIKHSELPERYICFVCSDTPGVRRSSRYLYNQDWQRQGKLPKLDFLTSVSSDGSKKESIIRESQKHLQKLENTISALSAIHKLLDSTVKRDMYELALWSAEDTNESHSQQVSLEQENLIIHINEAQKKIDADLKQMQTDISDLENQMGIQTFNGKEDLLTCGKSLHTLINDVGKVTKLTELADTVIETREDEIHQS